jgi:hypothetical protein
MDIFGRRTGERLAGIPGREDETRRARVGGFRRAVSAGVAAAVAADERQRDERRMREARRLLERIPIGEGRAGDGTLLGEPVLLFIGRGRRLSFSTARSLSAFNIEGRIVGSVETSSTRYRFREQSDGVERCSVAKTAGRLWRRGGWKYAIFSSHDQLIATVESTRGHRECAVLQDSRLIGKLWDERFSPQVSSAPRTAKRLSFASQWRLCDASGAPLAMLATNPGHGGLVLAVEPGLGEPLRTVALAVTAVVVHELAEGPEGGEPL